MTPEELVELERAVGKVPPLTWGRVPPDEEPDTMVFGAAGLFFGRIVGTSVRSALDVAIGVGDALAAVPKLVAEVRRLRDEKGGDAMTPEMTEAQKAAVAVLKTFQFGSGWSYSWSMVEAVAAAITAAEDAAREAERARLTQVLEDRAATLREQVAEEHAEQPRAASDRADELERVARRIRAGTAAK